MVDKFSSPSRTSISATSQGVQTTSPTAEHFSPSVQNDAIKQELAELYAKYEALRVAKERNDAKHAQDYDEWRRFREWICTAEDDAEDNGNTPASSSRKKRSRRRVTEIRGKLAKLQLYVHRDFEGQDNDVKHKSMILSASKFVSL